MKTAWQHRCARQHRSYHALAVCMFPDAAWIEGNGDYASLARCRILTVTLYPTREQAEQAKARIDQLGCGGQCHRRHDIIRLALKAIPGSGE